MKIALITTFPNAIDYILISSVTFKLPTLYCEISAGLS